MYVPEEDMVVMCLLLNIVDAVRCGAARWESLRRHITHIRRKWWECEPKTSITRNKVVIDWKKYINIWKYNVVFFLYTVCKNMVNWSKPIKAPVNTIRGPIFFIASCILVFSLHMRIYRVNAWMKFHIVIIIMSTLYILAWNNNQISSLSITVYLFNICAWFSYLKVFFAYSNRFLIKILGVSSKFA